MRTPPRRAATATGAPTTTVGAKVMAGHTSGQAASGQVRPRDSERGGAIEALVVAGDRELASERFAELAALQQRRAARIAYHYLRYAHDADEAVQDALVKVFTHITTYREDLPF